ncbi:MAG: hypothetical protein V4858_27285 [Pseudomonadota bacterium]
MMDGEQQADASPPDLALKTTSSELTRLAHLFRHAQEDPADRYLFDLVSCYRGGEVP